LHENKNKSNLAEIIFMSDTYFSISKESHGVYREKASKFMAFAFPVSTEQEIHAKLQLLKKEYHDANHHCFAYLLGQHATLYRAFDDGEPSGSAGKPILGQIVSMNLSDVLVIVIRYFGGTKLGIPGLINAYRIAARRALEDVEIIPKYLEVKYQIKFNFADLNEAMKILKNPQIRIQRKNIDQECTFVFSLRKSLHATVMERLTKISSVSVFLLD